MIKIHDSLDDSATLTVERADTDGQTVLLNVTADAKGVFHPFWPDTRSGTYHVYTARVEVVPSAVAASRSVSPVRIQPSTTSSPSSG